MNENRKKELRKIEQENKEWIRVRKTRLSSSLLRKAVTNTEKILNHIDTDEFIGLITIGVLIETLIFNIFKKSLSKTGLWTDKDLPYVVGSPDGICTIDGERVPVEVKSSKNAKTPKKLINEYYFQLQSYMCFMNSDILLLIHYEINEENLKFIIVHRDKGFKKKFFPLIERSYWKFLAKKFFHKSGYKNYLDLIKNKSLKIKPLKYYKGDFKEEKKDLNIPEKSIKFEEIRMERVIRKGDLCNVKQTLRESDSGLDLEKLNKLTELNFYVGRESYIEQRIKETEAFLRSLKKIIN